MEVSQFQAILDKTLPRDDCPPFDARIGEPFLHLLIFVHQIEGLAPGLYFLLRNPAKLQRVQEAATEAGLSSRG